MKDEKHTESQNLDKAINDVKFCIEDAKNAPLFAKERKLTDLANVQVRCLEVIRDDIKLTELTVHKVSTRIKEINARIKEINDVLVDKGLIKYYGTLK